jgi:hypothetical protein
MTWLWAFALALTSLVLLVGIVLVVRQDPEPADGTSVSAETSPRRTRPSREIATTWWTSEPKDNPSFWIPMGPAFEWTTEDDRQLIEMLQQGAHGAQDTGSAPQPSDQPPQNGRSGHEGRRRDLPSGSAPSAP